MWWDCKKDGCFNDKKRIKLGEFDTCFPRGAGFGDVDAVVEINGSFLLMEWKDPSCGLISGGQWYMFREMTKDGKWTVVIVYGYPETMEIVAIDVISKGNRLGKEPCDLERLRLRVKTWSDRVDAL